MFEKGRVFVNDNKNSSNIKVRNGMEIHGLQEVEDIEDIEVII
ncbi:hypothetical protein [Clostridium yunnanense]|nr:hypothetical protein [Clostridium yunnanense]